jgi:hypothetical protein
MSITGVSAASALTSGQQTQQLGQHKHGRHHASLTDIDAQSSSGASSPSSTGKIGSRVNLSA